MLCFFLGDFLRVPSALLFRPADEQASALGKGVASSSGYTSPSRISTLPSSQATPENTNEDHSRMQKAVELVCIVPAPAFVSGISLLPFEKKSPSRSPSSLGRALLPVMHNVGVCGGGRLHAAIVR